MYCKSVVFTFENINFIVKLKFNIFDFEFCLQIKIVISKIDESNMNRGKSFEYFLLHIQFFSLIYCRSSRRKQTESDRLTLFQGYLICSDRKVDCKTRTYFNKFSSYLVNDIQKVFFK